MIPEKIFEYRRRSVLFYYYVLKKFSCNEIGELFGVDWSTILYWLRKNKIEMRTRSEAGKGRPCSEKTKQKIREATLKNNPGGFKVGENHRLWKGGSESYYRNIAIRVWEDYWMQSVPKGQLVHHFDGNVENNEVTNLVNMPWAFHTSYHRNKIKSEPI